jgi:hypothetical protein
MIAVRVQIDDQATPALAQVRDVLGKPLGLHTRIAGRVETLVRDYIRTTGDDRHATARRLNATPTLHYIRSAQTVKGKAVPTGAEVTLRGEIFARVDRDVTVTARKSKYLTIPNTRYAYGRRAREIGGLRFVKFRNGTMALVRDVVGGGPLSTTTRRSVTVVYWLKKSVLLKKDRSLLPSDAAFAEQMEAGAEDYLIARFEARQAGRHPNMI